MIFSKHNVKDIERYYNHTIVKLQETGDRLWQVSRITPSEVEFTDVDGFTLTADLNFPYEVNYPLPGRVMYQEGPRAVLLSRKPAKQYYRGLSNANTSLHYLRSHGGWNAYDITIQKLQQFVDKPCYFKLDALTESYDSWALSPIFAVASIGHLFALTKNIGYVDFDTKKVILASSMLKPEVSEIIPEGWNLE